ncbi:MAG: peptide chain release factor N(5)-glutamine methyltransferase [Parcubacteria group bacterium]|nr:peptide chain release factor N(5)-glutamine methyltransferase [Parcubacteria group bacterium]
MIIKKARQNASKNLQATSDSPTLDAEVLLCLVLGISKEKLYGRLEQNLTAEQQKKYWQLVTRREKHEPIAYITKHKEFYGLDFYVDERVLIPRPDTEVLVETVIEEYGDVAKSKTIADIGTGSGCIAVALAKNLPQAKIYAVDISPEALAVAKINIKKHEVQGQIELKQGNLFEPLPEKVDTVVSNPPYLAQERTNEIKSDVIDHEPHQALFAGSDGLKYYQELLAQAQNHLRPSGLITLEIDPLVVEDVTQLAQKYFPPNTPQIKKDLAGKERVLIIKTS